MFFFFLVNAGFRGFGQLHIFEAPDLHKEDGLPPVLWGRGENKTKPGAKKARLLGEVTLHPRLDYLHCQEKLSPAIVTVILVWTRKQFHLPVRGG